MEIRPAKDEIPRLSHQAKTRNVIESPALDTINAIEIFTIKKSPDGSLAIHRSRL
ncbi:hypothetical protein [Saccharibacillus sacchari]|uniref:Uncharacterized protein n=1 Tax=Saccharibacillus sacchari TaxID=456493 RepID=A0ACC6PCH1_9BACL